VRRASADLRKTRRALARLSVRVGPDDLVLEHGGQAIGKFDEVVDTVASQVAGQGWSDDYEYAASLATYQRGEEQIYGFLGASRLLLARV